MRYLEDTEQVEFIVTMKDGGWFGLLPGDTGMAQNADILAFFADGDNSSFGDYTSIGYQPPEIDSIQDLEAHPVNMVEKDPDGRVTLFVRRALDTGDERDFVFPLDQEFDMAYAYNDEANELSWLTKHQLAGHFKMTLPSNGDPVLGSLPEVHGGTGGDGGDNTVIEDDGLDIGKALKGYLDMFFSTDGASEVSKVIGTLSAVSIASAMLF